MYKAVRRLVRFVILWAALSVLSGWWVMYRADRPWADSWDIGLFIGTVLTGIIIALFVAHRRRKRASVAG